MTFPGSFPLFAVAASMTARASRACREDQEADDQRYATLCRKQAQLRSLEDEPLLVDEPMTNQQHPVTPPPELFQQLADLPRSVAFEDAYRAGADQKLEACVEWVASNISAPEAAELRAAMRPKPPSLKEQALGLVPEPGGIPMKRVYSPNELLIVRRALECLPDV